MLAKYDVSNPKPLHRVRLMKFLSLILGLLAFPTLAHAQTLPDAKWWSQGPWLAYAAPWGSGSLVQGRDFADEITVVPTTFPAGTVIRWQWPLQNPAVRGYNHLAYGAYNGGAVRQPVAPLRISTARTLRYEFNITLNPSIGEFNVLHEDFLLKPDGTKAIEVGWFHHIAASQLPWIKRHPQLRDCWDRYSRRWSIYLAPSGPAYPDIKFATFIPDGDFLVGRIEKLDAYRCLIRDGALKGDETWTGTATGVEPVSGSGSILINRLAIVAN